MSVTKEVLERITPSLEDKQAMRDATNKIIKELKSEFSGCDEVKFVEIYGSISRDTWLTHDKDIDVFVGFDKTCSKKYMENVISAAGKKILSDTVKQYAEHPYIKGKYRGFSVEIVPSYDIKDTSERISAVDRTRFHDAYIKENLAGRQNDVRLLKQFLRGIGCYGAEIKVEGFSGYLCELLVLKFGSFEEVLKAVATWTTPVTLTPISRESTSQKFSNEVLIVTDPTDENRNVASALSDFKLSLFITASKEYQKNPGHRFFFPIKRILKREVLIKNFRVRKTHLISVTFTTPEVIDDILYSQIKKALKFFNKRFEEAEHSVINSGFYVGEKTALAFEFEHAELPVAQLHTGPKVNSENESKFIDKHKASKTSITNPVIENGRWAVLKQRKFVKPEDLLENFLSDTNLEQKGVPKYIAAEVYKDFKILTGVNAVEGDLEFFTQFFDPRFPWEPANV